MIASLTDRPSSKRRRTLGSSGAGHGASSGMVTLWPLALLVERPPTPGPSNRIDATSAPFVAVSSDTRLIVKPASGRTLRQDGQIDFGSAASVTE